MDTALEWARELGSPPPLPPSLADVNKRAELVNTINGPLARADLRPQLALHQLSKTEKAQRLDKVERLSRRFIPDISSDDRTNIALRLWSGCLSAAKTIALETMSGPNTPQSRARDFAHIDLIAQRDPIYCAGVEAAPTFKSLLCEPYCFDGVPQSSPVRKYP